MNDYPVQSSLSSGSNDQIGLPSVDQPMLPTNGYVMVGDNIDKTVRPSFQRLDRTTQSYCTTFIRIQF